MTACTSLRGAVATKQSRGARRTPFSFLQRQLNELVSAVGFVEISARGDDRLELRRGNRQDGRRLLDAPHLLVEVPHELAAGALLRVALAVLREDGDARTEERHLV